MKQLFNVSLFSFSFDKGIKRSILAIKWAVVLSLVPGALLRSCDCFVWHCKRRRSPIVFFSGRD